ncbi:MAG: TonB-dependent receptor [Mediterranea sp.]|jgi:iron complex outermembrane receptor protein|nr:TonB-dependent receptor [Mediterranea sp.]
MKQSHALIVNKILPLVMGLFLSLNMYAQQITVKGHVQDSFGPVAGANVLIKGTSEGTITDADGNFTLPASTGALLEISFIGYKTVEIAAAPTLSVTLSEDSELLADVVVIGYGTVKKNDMTGSVTAIKPDEISKGITTSAQDMLAGKVAGVNVTSNDGQPGGGATVRIRGGSSLNASNDPLIVIDGLAIDNEGIKGMANGLSMVNPEDIETFTVLKDASATAIYGSRASNGVIIITTKKGRSGQAPRVTYSGNVSFSTTQKRYEVLSGDEYRAYANQLWGGALPGELGTANTDWQDQIFRTGVNTDHYVSVNGGIGNIPYRASFGYTHNNGIIKTSSFQRITASVNLAPSFFDDYLKFNITAKYMNGKNRYADTGAALGGALSMDPTHPVYADGEAYQFSGGYFQWMQASSNISDPTNWKFMPNPNTPANPLAALEQKSDKANSNDFVGNVEVDYRFHFFPDMRVHASIGGEYAEGRQHTVVSPYSRGNNYYGWDGYNTQYKYNLSMNAYLQYTKSVGVNDIDVMAGGEEQHFHRNGADGVGQGWDPGLNAPANIVQWSEKRYATRNTLVSYFGRLNYTLLNRYLLTFTMRLDGSSRFDKENRWGQFPSVALAWKIKEESFLRDVDALSDLKLRLGWGITGQQNIGQDFAYAPLYLTNDSYAQYPFGDTYYNSSRPTAYNTKLKWEQTTTWNGGLDFGFLNGRITSSVDAYYRETKDLLNSVIIPVGTNFNAQMLQNIGSLENYGVEFSINAKPIVTNDFTWDLSYNVAWNHNEITKLTGGDDSSYYVEAGESISRGNNTKVQAQKVGSSINSFYVYQQVYDTNGSPIENMFVDRNGDGIINASDKYIYKKPGADVTMGLTSKFLYKQWDLSFALRSNLGNYVYYDFLSNRSNVSVSGLWSNSAFSQTTQEAIDLGFSGKGDYYMSDYFVRNASFVRCDNITLGYSFDDLIHTTGYKGLNGRVYATVQNPFVITKYKGLDPEVQSGVDKNLYPRAMTFLLGLNINF